MRFDIRKNHKHRWKLNKFFIDQNQKHFCWQKKKQIKLYLWSSETTIYFQEEELDYNSEDEEKINLLAPIFSQRLAHSWIIIAVLLMILIISHWFNSRSLMYANDFWEEKTNFLILKFELAIDYESKWLRKFFQE